MTHITSRIASASMLALLLVAPVATAKGQPEDAGPGRAPTSTPGSAFEDRRIGSDERPGASTEEGDTRRSGIDVEVHTLLRAADRDGGVGAEVREIAREMASSSERAQEAKVKAESRPGWMSVLIGADYKSLGELRSEIVTLENQISRLIMARDRATDPVLQAELDSQIEALEEQASSTQAFIEDEEDSFSFFGWFFRLF